MNAIVKGWAEHANYPEIQFDNEGASQKISELSEQLLELVTKKENSPVEPVGTEEDKQKVNELWASVLVYMDRCNEEIDVVNSKITKLKEELDSENAQQLKEQIEKINLALLRHKPNVAELITDLVLERNKKKDLEKRKNEEKSRLNNIMEKTLGAYSEATNRLLEAFGASFRIAKIGYNYMGGSPRTQYALKLRGEQVKLSGDAPGFSTVLSDGDKRTLAFAFFVARVQSDADIEDKIVVIDDPMTGLDENRKRHAREVLRDIYKSAGQLIVLAHDLYFLRDLRNDLNNTESTETVQNLKLDSAEGGYTDIGQLDIDEDCNFQIKGTYNL